MKIFGNLPDSVESGKMMFTLTSFSKKKEIFRFLIKNPLNSTTIVSSPCVGGSTFHREIKTPKKKSSKSSYLGGGGGYLTQFF